MTDGRLTDREILALTLTLAKTVDDPDPTSVSYVRGPMTLIGPFSQNPTELIAVSTLPQDVAHPHVVLVDMYGHFTALRAHPPRRARLPTGTEARFVLDEPTQTLVSWGVSGLRLDLSRVGDAVVIK